MEGEKNSSGDLMSSSKLVAEAAKTAYEKKSVEGIDKEKVAAASAEILDSAAKYGKLEDKPVGQYLEKAEGYLKQYSSGGTEKEKTDAPADADAPKPDAPKETAPAPAPAAEEEKSSDGFGLDDVMKGAASLSGKKSGEEEKESGGGGGGFMKMAQGFMK